MSKWNVSSNNIQVQCFLKQKRDNFQRQLSYCVKLLINSNPNFKFTAFYLYLNIQIWIDFYELTWQKKKTFNLGFSLKYGFKKVFFKNEPLISCPFLSSKLDSPVIRETFFTLSGCLSNVLIKENLIWMKEMGNWSEFHS